MSRLFLRIGREAVPTNEGLVIEELEWVLLHDSGELVSRGVGDGSALAGLLGTRAALDPDEIVVLVPTELCLSLQCMVPGRTTGQMRRALPFVVEEFLASDVENLHLAHGPLRRGQAAACLALDRRHIEGWLAALGRIGVVPGHLVPAGMLLPSAPDRVALLFDGEAVLARTPGQALATDAEQLVFVLSTAVSEMGTGDEDGEIEVLAINGQLAPIDRAQVEQNATKRIRWTSEETDETTLAYLAKMWRSAPPNVDLLQGEFAPPRRRSAAWQRWRAVAALAGLWVLVGLAADVTKGAWASHRAGQLGEEATALYREYFPGDRRVQNIKRQMAQHLGDVGASGPGFIPLVGFLGKALEKSADAELLSLGFTDARSELAVDLTLPGYEALETLKNELSSSSLETDISSAEQQEKRVRARLKIRMPPT